MELSVEQRLRRELVSLLPRLRRFARALTGNWHQADDLVQEAVTRAVASDGGAARLGHLDGWMFRIMRNTWVDIQRAQRIRRNYADTIVATSQLESGGEDAAIATMTLRAVNDALQSLPDDHRTVLLLVCVDEFSYAQAAEMLGVPVGTVMSRLARGRAALRKLVNGAARTQRCTEPAVGVVE